MASAQEPAVIRLVAEDPQGNRYPVLESRSEVTGPGACPDGVLANATEDKWPYLPVGGPVLSTGWKVIVMFKLDAADGIDVSDGVDSIPLTVSGMGLKRIARADHATTDHAAATIAGVWHDLGTGYTIPSGMRAKIGGGKFCINLEDDTG